MSALLGTDVAELGEFLGRSNLKKVPAQKDKALVVMTRMQVRRLMKTLSSRNQSVEHENQDLHKQLASLSAEQTLLQHSLETSISEREREVLEGS